MWSDLCGGNAASSPEGYPAAALIDEEEFLYIWNTAASAAWETAIETSAMIVLDNPMIRGTSEADRIAAEIRYLSDKAPVQ
jgi:hypothetical protein